MTITPFGMLPLINPVPRAGPFDHPDWLFEAKFDGFRAAADTVRRRLISRKGNRMRRFEVVLDLLPGGVVLDGEVVVHPNTRIRIKPSYFGEVGQGSISMKFGLHNSSWLDRPHPADAFEAVKAKAQWAESHGFVWFSVLDHMIQIPRVGEPDEPFIEGWTALAALATVTTRIRLATLCTAVGYRNPAHLAKIASSVDVISRGRLTLGIGAGFFEDEYRQYGWEFPPRPATRIQQMEEAVRLIVKMWTERRTTFHGRYFHVEDAILEPKPIQKPRPPILIAGGGEQMTLRAVARLGDACNIVDGDLAEVRHKLTVLRRHCDEADRDYDTIEKTRIEPWLIARDPIALNARRDRLATSGPLRGFVGTVSEAIDLVGQYQEVGIDLLINADRRQDEESREIFASDVMPHFA